MIPDKEFLPILNTRYDQRGQPIYLDLSEDKLKGGCPIVIFSGMGAGKTVFKLNLVSEMVKAGFLVCNLFDVKSDFYHAMKPLQQGLRRFLPPWSQPGGLQIKPFVPRYIADIAYKKATDKPKNMNIGQVQVSDITSDDLIDSIFRMNPNEPAAALVRRLWRVPPQDTTDLKNRLENINQLGSGQFGATEFQSTTVSGVGRRLEDIVSEGLVGDKFPMNFPMEMAAGNIPCLSFEGHGELKINYTQAVVASISRQIYAESLNPNGILYGRKKAVVIDDAGKILPPAPNNPSCKQPIIYNFSKVGRQFNIFTIVSAQNVSDVDKEIIKAARYIVGLRQMSPPDLDSLAEIKGIRQESFEDFYSGIPKPMRIDSGPYTGAREAIIWDTDRPEKPMRGWVPCPPCGINQVVS